VHTPLSNVGSKLQLNLRVPICSDPLSHTLPHTYSVTLSDHELFDRGVQTEGFITLLLVKKGVNQKSL
jgi:hypothetical protein